MAGKTESKCTDMQVGSKVLYSGDGEEYTVVGVYAKSVKIEREDASRYVYPASLSPVVVEKPKRQRKPRGAELASVA